MKGIILAGGSGTRLYPLTLSVSKQILPVYDKPMIYYPLSMLMLAGIQDIMIISTPHDIETFKSLFGNGKGFGINIEYAVQEKPNGLPEAFVIGEKFVGHDSVCLVLGDNVFFGSGMRKRLIQAREEAENGKSTIFGFFVNDPERFGVAEFDSDFNVLSIEEKPANPKSNYAITGMYFCDNKAVRYAKECVPSNRGETEIIDVIRRYLDDKKLRIDVLGRGFSWFDCGTHDSLAEATTFVRMVESHQGMQISCLEEIAYINGWMNKDELLERAKKMGKSSYADHLKKVAEGKIVY